MIRLGTSRGAEPASRIPRFAFLIAALLAPVAALCGTTALAPGQSHYLESCGGCHGIEGISSPRDIPQLRGVVGIFLCSRAGREYIVRLPNVAFSGVDDQTLAELLNFMVFRLGGASTPAGAHPYTASEVNRLRREPLKHQSLEKLRLAILMDAANACASPPHDGQHELSSASR